MKAIVFKEEKGQPSFVLEDTKLPKLLKNEVLIKIHAAAFNPVDYQAIKNPHERKLLKSNILGRELSGIIVKAGKQVVGFSVGDLVAAYVGNLASNGAFAEYINVPQELIAIKPSNISLEEAASIPLVGLTALQCFERLSVPLKETIFISGGAGGVGNVLIRLMLAHGIHNITTTVGNQKSKDKLLKTGIRPENIFDYHEPNLKEKLIEHNGGKPLAYCIDLVGGSIADICSHIIAPNGIYCNVTNLTSSSANDMFFDKGVIILNISNYTYALNNNATEYKYYGDKLKFLFSLIERGIIVTAPIKILKGLTSENVVGGLKILESNRSHGHKIVLKL